MTTLCAGFPRLAWYAELDQAEGTCHVEHGPFVAVDPAASGPNWIAAGVWDGPFIEGNFHDCPHLFGSGVRVAGDEVHLVPASTMLGRIFYAQDGARVMASNSLVVMLARLGTRLSADLPHHLWSEGCCFGRFEYVPSIAVQGGGRDTIRQVIFESLVVGRRGLRFQDRSRRRQFSDFGDYVGALHEGLGQIWANATDPRRAQRPRAVSSASRGYDSLTATAFALDLAPVTSYTAVRSNTRMPAALIRLMGPDLTNDDGSLIAARLGATARLLDLDMSAIPGELERWMWAAGHISPELLFWQLLRDADEAASASEEVTLWFSGHGGDMCWEVDVLDPRVLTGAVPRGTPSGVPHAEAALRYGIIDCTVPFLFATSYDSVVAISGSDEMTPWRLDNGYDRPIPRRILEGRGVDRRDFGFGKKMVAQDLDSPQGLELRAMFFADTSWNRLSERSYRALNLGLYSASRLAVIARTRADRDVMLGIESLPKNSIEHFVPRAGLRRSTFLYCANGLADDLSAVPAGPAAAAATRCAA